MHIVECSEELIHIDLSEERVNALLKAFEVFDYTIDVGRDHVHDDVKQRVFCVSGLRLIAEKCVLDFHDVLMMHIFVNLKFSALVLLVLF